jgi:CelD/BcsL family acetyltransferase involved in cellulose biosynthesis
MRATPLTHWLDTFASDKPTRFVAVEQEGRLIAALPLIGDWVGRWIRVGRLPDSDLCSVGDLLLDRSWEGTAAEQPLDVLLGGVRDLGWPLVFLDAVTTSATRWQAFIAAAQRAGMNFALSRRGTTGLVDIAGEWSDYVATRSRNHRRHMRVISNRSEQEGPVALNLVFDATAHELEVILHRGFGVEDRSWKGTDGSSVLRTPGAFAFFTEQAKLMGAEGNLMLAFAELHGLPIAFEYGWLAKGVYHSLKVGYDATYERLSPGQLLRLMMIKKFHEEGRIRLVDYLGPLCDATQKWITRSYDVDRVVLGNGLIGKALLWEYARRTSARRSLPEPEEEVLSPTTDLERISTPTDHLAFLEI